MKNEKFNKQESEIIKKIIECDLEMRDAPEWVKHNKHVLLHLIEFDISVLEHADLYNVRDDEIFMLAAILIEPLSFEYSSPRLKDNFDFVKKVLFRHAFSAYKYISDRLKDNEEFAKLAIIEDPNLFREMSDRLQNDKKMIEFALNRSPLVMNYISEKNKKYFLLNKR